MFITFEGPEGSGKTSQITLLSAYLRQQGFSVISTHEPGGTSIGDQIRACLHDVRNTAITAVAEVLLYSASRAQLVQEIIRPALNAGCIVLCDRYADSTLAYQGYGRGLSLADLNELTRIATQGLRPELTVLFDIEVESGLARRRLGGDEMNRLDLETVAFHRRVRQGYNHLRTADPIRWAVVDADQPVDVVQAAVREVVTQRLKAKPG